MGTLAITSPSFRQNGMIPAKYTCDGENVSPPLTIGNAPRQTRSLALIVDDPDAPAGIWVHWVLWNIGPDIRELGENSVPPGASQGLNDFGRKTYGGPCPPSGTHRYFFKLYALDAMLELAAATSKSGLLSAMQGHILGQSELVGLYRRN